MGDMEDDDEVKREERGTEKGDEDEKRGTKKSVAHPCSP